ncbi:GNAT family N-acetyltransferase [Methanosarcina barkeri]|uniref:GNAT family acetyltransferase n=1 Tax=Methanosarcina barkeri CM1 TaxID=796385 RepID=A0A0G3CAN9_METBA|nr:N-acetyltransferase [Methanosarcina barkeri]AKJ37730.1 GNAT family acetyltransferase [Methanosarcina barkeri CM1]
MGTIKIHTRSVGYLMNLKKLLQDTTGNLLVKKWKSIEKGDIVSIEDDMLPEVLRIQAEGFKNGSSEKLIRYSKNSKNIFYVMKSKDEIVGYCVYYLKPAISLKGFEKKSVISSIATDKNFRGRGFAERLLRISTEEMKVNGISSVLLYVNINNLPAIYLYKKIGFRKIKKVKNICSQKESCYEMELRLT